MRFAVTILIFFFMRKCDAQQRVQVSFCGEPVPVHHSMVWGRLKAAVAKMKRNYFNSHSAGRTSKYLTYFSYELQQAGIPEDFKYLPIVESSLTNEVSGVGAAGYWQIMPATGRELDMEVNSFSDERYNVIKSTKAAVKYLRWLQQRVGSWTLVAAAYNCGAGNIHRAQRRGGNLPYYFLPLPEETREYVYKIIACKLIVEGLDEPEEDTGYTAPVTEIATDTVTRKAITAEVAVTIPETRLSVELIGKGAAVSGSQWKFRFTAVNEKYKIEKWMVRVGELYCDSTDNFLVFSIDGNNFLRCRVERKNNSPISGIADGEVIYLFIKKGL